MINFSRIKACISRDDTLANSPPGDTPPLEPLAATERLEDPEVQTEDSDGEEEFFDALDTVPRESTEVSTSSSKRRVVPPRRDDFV